MQARFNEELQRKLEGTRLDLGRLRQLVSGRARHATPRSGPASPGRYRRRTRRFDPGDYELRPRTPRPARAQHTLELASPHEPHEPQPHRSTSTAAPSSSPAPRAASAPRPPSACTPRAQTSRWSASSPSGWRSSPRGWATARRAFEADVTDFDALQRAVGGTVERFGGIDVAIANAGVAFTGSLATAPIEQVERTLAVNLLGVWRTDRAVIEQHHRAPRLPAEHLLAERRSRTRR